MRKPVIRESTIERKVCRAAEDRGWLVRKFASPAHRGQPDRIFMRDGVVFFIEFKARGGRLSPLQSREIALIKAQGVQAFVIDSVEDGEALLDVMEDSYAG
jgi:Holliday junction resolvase